MSLSHSQDIMIEREKKYRLTNQIITVLEAERDRLRQMVVDNSDSPDEMMAYVIFAWEKYADSMDDVLTYFTALQERDT